MGTYSFTDFHVALSGPGGVISLGDGSASAEEGITFEMKEDANKMVTGADGSVMHSLNASRSGVARIRLLKTSPVNKQMAALYTLQRTSGALWGKNVITANDIARGDEYVCRQVAFLKFPSNTYGKDAGILEWEMDVGVMDPNLGDGG